MNNSSRLSYLFGTLAVVLGLSGADVHAQQKKKEKPPKAVALTNEKKKIPFLTAEQHWFERCQDRMPVGQAYSIINLDSGDTILERNQHVQVPIASLTKLMTLLMVSEAIDEKLINEDALVPIDTSWNIKPNGARITGVLTGWRKPVSLKSLMMAASTASSNDAPPSLAIAVAKARGWGETEADFVKAMNDRAKQMGLKFVASNASGLPEHERDVLGQAVPLEERGATVGDVSKLMRHIVLDHPRVAKMLGTKKAKFDDREFLHVLRNLLDFKIPGFSAKTEAVKSGMTCAAGYAASIVHGNMVLTFVGAKSHLEREELAKDLLQQGHAYQELMRSVHEEFGPR